MRTLGIIAEYNPFHMGHRYHIDEAKRVSGADRVVVIMSASFVQRGEPACADKFRRAEWAVLNGADMVIELPDVFSCSCAERFASGAVRILSGTGIVDALCFGSETGDIEYLKEAAFKEPDPGLFSEAMDSGLSYPAAVMEASASPFPLKPNDILGIEYIRAAKKYGLGFEFFCVKREGQGHDEKNMTSEFSSALAIRKAIADYSVIGSMTPERFDFLKSSLPKNVLDDICSAVRAGVFPASDNALSDAVIYCMRRMSAEEIARLPEVSEGLENLFKRYSLECGSYFDMLKRVKSKRYTMARLKRISMYALLGVTSELQDRAYNDDSALYARVLAVKESSMDMLGKLSENASIPVIVRSSDREKLSEVGRRVEAVSNLAHSVKAVGQPYDKSVKSDMSYRLVVR